MQMRRDWWWASPQMRMLKCSCENSNSLWAKKRWQLLVPAMSRLSVLVDDNVEQLQVAVLGVGVVTLDVDTAAPQRRAPLNAAREQEQRNSFEGLHLSSSD